MVRTFLNISLATKMPKNLTFMHIYSKKMSAYRRDVDETNYISFLVKNDELPEKYNDI